MASKNKMIVKIKVPRGLLKKMKLKEMLDKINSIQKKVNDELFIMESENKFIRYFS